MLQCEKMKFRKTWSRHLSSIVEIMTSISLFSIIERWQTLVNILSLVNLFQA